MKFYFCFIFVNYLNLKFQIQLLDSVSDLIIILFFVLMLCWCCQIWINLHLSLKPVIVIGRGLIAVHVLVCHMGSDTWEWHMGTRGEWHMGTLEAVELGHARWGDLADSGHQPLLQRNCKYRQQPKKQKKLKCTSIATKKNQCQNQLKWSKCTH